MTASRWVQGPADSATASSGGQPTDPLFLLRGYNRLCWTRCSPVSAVLPAEVTRGDSDGNLCVTRWCVGTKRLSNDPPGSLASEHLPCAGSVAEM